MSHRLTSNLINLRTASNDLEPSCPKLPDIDNAIICRYKTALRDLLHKVTNTQLPQRPSPDHFCRAGLP